MSFGKGRQSEVLVSSWTVRGVQGWGLIRSCGELRARGRVQLPWRRRELEGVQVDMCEPRELEVG